MKNKKPTYEELESRVAVLERRLEEADLEIAAYQKAEDRLGKDEKLFRRLVENSPDIILHWSPAFGVEYINPSVKKITGYAPDEIIGNMGFLVSKIHPEDRPAFIDFLLGFNARDGRTSSLNVRFITKDDSVISIFIFKKSL